MAKSVFTKHKLMRYFVFLIVVAVISVGVAIGCYLYFGHSAESQGATDDFNDKLLLGKTFTTTDLIKDQDYNYGWIKSDDVVVEVYSVDSNGEEELSTEILSYNVSSCEFNVIGVAKGKIKYINNFDASVNFTVPFETEFASSDTMAIIQENYPQFLDDGIVTESEIKDITVISLRNKLSVNLADFESFVNLKRLEIGNLPGAELISFNNFVLVDDTIIYVPNERYLGYMSLTDEVWKSYSNRIFPSVPSSQYHSIVLYKNGGAFADDNGMLYDAVEVSTNGCLNFSTDYEISREGYQFGGWFLSDDGITPRGDILSDESIFTSDAKLCALWYANKYTVRMYHNDGTDRYTDKVFTYDNESKISDILPKYGDFIQLGWAYSEDEVEADFVKQEVIKNLTSENEKLIEVYAIWAYDQFSIQFYTWNINKEYSPYGSLKHVRYGENIILSSSDGAPTSIYGSFKGWALMRNSAEPDFQYGDVTDRLFVTSKTDGVLHVYPVFEEEAFDLIYDAAGGLETPEGKSAYQRGISLYVSKSIERTGYKFKGWKDDAGFIWTSEDLYTADSTYYNTYYNNKVKPLQDTEYGWLAPTGIDTISSSQVTLTAIWVANKFTVKFTGDTTDATYYTSATVTYGVTTNFTGELQKKGNSVASCKSDYGNVSLSGRTLSVSQIATIYNALKGTTSNNDFNNNSVVTFTVLWSKNSYTITFNYNGGSGSTTNTQITYGSSYGTLPTPSTNKPNSDYCSKGCCYTYYTFSHWEYNNQRITSTTTMNTASAHTLNAVWSSSKHTQSHCLASGTLITMADGTTKKVEDLAVGDMVLTIDHETGSIGANPVALLIDHDRKYEWKHMCKLHFDDGTEFKIIGTHSLFDLSLNCYVVVNLDNAADYLNHEFYSVKFVDGEIVRESKKLVSYELYDEYCGTYTVMTAQAWNVFADGFLTIPSGEDLMGDNGGECLGLLNIFTFDSNLKWDEEERLSDIEKYGLCEYSEFSEYMSETVFEIFKVKYFKIMDAKGVIDMELFIEKLKSLGSMLK